MNRMNDYDGGDKGFSVFNKGTPNAVLDKMGETLGEFGLNVNWLLSVGIFGVGEEGSSKRYVEQIRCVFALTFGPELKNSEYAKTL